MRSLSTTFMRFRMTSILSDTLAPPRIATQGRSGFVVALPRYSSSLSIKRPAAACGMNWIIPTVEACARCADPKASFT